MTATPTDTITDEQRGYAFLFVSALNHNKVLDGKWKDLQAKIKPLSVSDRIKSLDNFLADNGYGTRAEAVLGLLKSQWWQDYIDKRKQNADSDRFVQDVMNNPWLYKQYGAQLATAQNAKDLSVVDSWLTQQGYHCTAVQVDASFTMMRDKNMNYWTGIYGKTSIQQDGAEAESGPALLIYGNTSASLGPHMLWDVTYAKGVLSWQIGQDPKANPCAGQVTFGTITRPPTHLGDYVGNEFSGTLTYPVKTAAGLSGTYTYVGRIGDPPPNTAGKVTTPPAVDKSEIQKIADYVNPFIILGFGVTMVVGVLKFLFKSGKWVAGKAKKLNEKAESDVKESTGRLDSVTESPVKQEEFKDSTTLKTLQAELQETGDPQVREKMQKSIEDQKAAEKKYDEEISEKNKREQEAEDLEKDGIEADTKIDTKFEIK